MELKLDKRFIDEAVQEAVKDIKQNYISKDVLEKIRAEISSYDSIWVEYKIIGHTDQDIENIVENVLMQVKEQMLDIIDKYKAESEDKE